MKPSESELRANLRARHVAEAALYERLAGRYFTENATPCVTIAVDPSIVEPKGLLNAWLGRFDGQSGTA